jgi:hypothetical protein
MKPQPEGTKMATKRTLKDSSIQVTYRGEYRELEHRIPGVGEKGILVTSEHVYKNTNEVGVGFMPDNGEGIPGNMDRNICRYHGWRGTTNDVATYAHGLREVIARRETTNTTVVTFGPDLKADEK